MAVSTEFAILAVLPVMTVLAILVASTVLAVLAILFVIEDMARYAGLLQAPTEGFGRGFFCPWGKKERIMRFWPIFGNVLCLVITLVTFGSNLSNFERNSKKTPAPPQKKILNNQKYP